MTYRYGDTIVELLHLGPGHTWGDALVYLPQHRILFAGDVAFHYVVPTAWQGHVTKWIEVVDRILAMDVDTIVPGHGPIGGKDALVEMREYYAVLKPEARKRFDGGMTVGQAAADIDMGRFATWNNPERIVANTLRLYAEFTGTIVPANDAEGTRRATEEYNALKAAPTT